MSNKSNQPNVKAISKQMKENINKKNKIIINKKREARTFIQSN